MILKHNKNKIKFTSTGYLAEIVRVLFVELTVTRVIICLLIAILNMLQNVVILLFSFWEVIQVRILFNLKLSDITSNYRTVAMFVFVDL